MNRLKVNLILILIVTLGFLLTSCKTQKNTNCDAYGYLLQDDDSLITLSIPYVDTIIMEPIHIHIENEYICCWLPKDTSIYYDTLDLKLIVKKNNITK